MNRINSVLNLQGAVWILMAKRVFCLAGPIEKYFNIRPLIILPLYRHKPVKFVVEILLLLR